MQRITWMETPFSSPSPPTLIEKYSPDKAYIVNLDYNNTLKINKTTLFFLPYYELLYRKI